jgi:hypothetical protein
MQMGVRSKKKCNAKEIPAFCITFYGGLHYNRISHVINAPVAALMMAVRMRSLFSRFLFSSLSISASQALRVA